MKFVEYDVVKLKVDDASNNLKAGTTGTIVLIHKSVESHYDVELCDDAGNTLALVASPKPRTNRVGASAFRNPDVPSNIPPT
ncbi:MAG: DUF4926 domain-containing protein [Myxococcota bacterium]|nr:DUF4926 domain-containing protein [Myxococcota bacterium]